jgi:membrane protein YdbS with pleckstrin-like domain
MMSRLEKTTEWLYGGIWGVMTNWFRVPKEPPAVPVAPNEHLQSFRPSEGFLRYLKFRFWLLLFVVDIALLIAWLGITAVSLLVGLWLAPLALAVMVLPDIAAYVAIHLRYDTTWYVLTHRSLRIRRGIWVIQETTITFENIQNVSVESGPLERWFGIANVIVDTAGGGPEKTSHGGTKENLHRGIIEGIDRPDEIRDLIMNRLRQSRSAGLGDDHATGPAWGTPHIAMLREIRDSLQHPRGMQTS